MLTAKRVRDLFNYDPETGVLRWKERPLTDFVDSRVRNIWNTKYAGQRAGATNDAGYVCVRVDGKNRKAHRLIWLLVTGDWPEDEIDHENHDRADNRWANLREATHAENVKNQSLHKSNTSGVAGVWWHKDAQKWSAFVHAGGKMIYLGLFEVKDDAIAARKAAEVEHGFHANHGKEAA